MTTVWDINLFYPLLFLLMIAIVITIGIVLVKGKDVKIFNKSSDNIKELALDNNKVHINTTDKFSKAHTEIIAGLPLEYHQELHSLEEKVKDVQSQLIELTEDINNKLDLIIQRIITLENKK